MSSRRIYSAAAKIVEVQLSNQQSLSSYCIASEVYLHSSECLVRPRLNTFHIVVVAVESELVYISLSVMLSAPGATPGGGTWST